MNKILVLIFCWATSVSTYAKGPECLYKHGNSAVCPSDERIKKDIVPFNLGLDVLLEIRPVKFKYNGLGGFKDDGVEQLGVIAQNIEKAAPSLVKTKLIEMHKGDAKKTEIKVVNYDAFDYVIINSLKEFFRKWLTDSKDIHRELTLVRKENNILKAENASIKSYLCKKDPKAEICH